MSGLVLAEFTTPEAALDAARALVKEGVSSVDLHSPYPLHGSDEALGLGHPRLVPAIALAAATLGSGGAYLLQYWTSAVDYPLIVGSRPPHSPLAFVPITFEVGVLSAGLAIMGALLVIWRLPRLHHPVWDEDGFASASRDAFWVSAPAAEGVVERLRGLGARRLSIVEAA